MQHLDLRGAFPLDRYPIPSDNQTGALRFVEGVLNSGREEAVVLELPTGTGKTALGYAFLKALQNAGASHLFYLVPNKTLAQQVQQLHPDVRVVYGRNEHPCHYYAEEKLRADEIPCSLLRDCPHRVNLETGETHEPGATPCSYLQQKYEAKQGGIVVATTAFYLFSSFFGKQFEPQGVVVDEAHRIAQSLRSVLEFDITDWKLNRLVDLLKYIESTQAGWVEEFRDTMIRLVRSKRPSEEVVLNDDEISTLAFSLGKIERSVLRAEIAKAVGQGDIDPVADREVLKQLEVLERDLMRYLRALEFSKNTTSRRPLSYTYAYWQEEKSERGRVQHRLVVKSYSVGGLIRAMLPTRTLAYSATVGDPDIFAVETGLKGPFKSFPSPFSAEHTRIYMPTDTPNLAVKERSRRDKTKALRKIARAAKHFADKGMRSLVVVVSNEERQKFLALAAEEGLNALSYDAKRTARECALAFRNGEGDALVGTATNYGEGVDLPRSLAPVIFFYRPGYARPNDPATIFEEQRFGRMRWSLWNWRVMIELLQVRGRNIRSVSDLGVTFLISQQFRNFAFASLPEWLRPAYRGKWTFEQCMEDATVLLGEG
jgi:Rad3-related DNA helicase